MKKLTILVIALFLIVAACEPKPQVTSPQAITPAITPTPLSALVPVAPAKPDWEEEWRGTVKAAKAEGKLVLFFSLGPDAIKPLVEAFRKKYGITVETMSASGVILSEKLLSERRAGIYLEDVIISGSTYQVISMKPGGVLDPLEPELFLPEVTNPEVWWNGTPFWIDKPYILGMLCYPAVAVNINTNLVKREEITSMYDLLDPKWKERIVMYDPRTGGKGGKWFAVHTLMPEGLGLDYMRKLAAQKPLITRDHRLNLEWLAHGKYPIALNVSEEQLGSFHQLGAPVIAIATKEPIHITSGSGNLSLANRRPHPNAAKLFVNWLLTKEGQTILSRATNIQVARIDVPTEHILPWGRLEVGRKYLNSEEPEFLKKSSEAYKLAEEVFGRP